MVSSNKDTYLHIYISGKLIDLIFTTIKNMLDLSMLHLAGKHWYG